jgi:hypothetical protein
VTDGDDLEDSSCAKVHDSPLVQLPAAKKRQGTFGPGFDWGGLGNERESLELSCEKWQASPLEQDPRA